MKRIAAFFLAFVMCMVLFAGCGQTGGEQGETGDQQEQEMLIEGLVEFSPMEMEALMKSLADRGDADLDTYFVMKTLPSFNSVIMELDSGKINVAFFGEATANYMKSQNDQYVCSPTGLTVSYNMATRMEDSELCDQLTAAINAIKEDGTMDSLIDNYVKSFDSIAEQNEPAGSAEKTYKVGVTGDFPPFDYVSADGIPSGFNIAMMNALGEKMGCNFEFVKVDYSARLAALASGKIDIIFLNFFYSYGEGDPAGDEGICLTGTYYQEDDYLVTLKDISEKIEALHKEYRGN